jgi:hypothetical protein
VDKFELFKDARGEPRFHLTAAYGEAIASDEDYAEGCGGRLQAWSPHGRGTSSSSLPPMPQLIRSALDCALTRASPSQ